MSLISAAAPTTCSLSCSDCHRAMMQVQTWPILAKVAAAVLVLLPALALCSFSAAAYLHVPMLFSEAGMIALMISSALFLLASFTAVIWVASMPGYAIKLEKNKRYLLDSHPYAFLLKNPTNHHCKNGERTQIEKLHAVAVPVDIPAKYKKKEITYCGSLDSIVVLGYMDGSIVFLLKDGTDYLLISNIMCTRAKNRGIKEVTVDVANEKICYTLITTALEDDPQASGMEHCAEFLISRGTSKPKRRYFLERTDTLSFKQ